MRRAARTPPRSPSTHSSQLPPLCLAPPQVGNNKGGVAGTAFKARILPCKALDSSGWGRISTVVECITRCR